MTAQIGILGNAAHESLARALQSLLPSAQIASFALPDLADVPARLPIFDALRGCTHILSQDVPPVFGMLSTRALVAIAGRVHVLPALEFAGFHPDTVFVKLDGANIPGPTGPYHSRIAVAAFLAGVPADETVRLYNALVFTRLNYAGALTREAAALTERMLAYGIDIAATVKRWAAEGAFMHSVDRPKMRVMMDMARIACALLGMAQEATPAELPADPSEALPSHPIFPDIAARIGIPPEGAFQGVDGPMTPTAFVQGSYKALQRVPLACLRAVPGVTQAMARLNLAPARQAARKPLPGTVALLGFHGTIVRLDRASGLLVHEKLWPDSQEGVDFTLTPKRDADGRQTADILPGLELIEGPGPGLIGLRRAGRFLSAHPSRLAVKFSAETMADTECFLALPVADIAALRRLLSQSWSCDEQPHRTRMALVDAYGLKIHDSHIDLRVSRPVPDDTNPDAMRIQTSSGALTLRALPASPSDSAIALLAAPASAYPPDAASLADFRTARERSWVLDNADAPPSLPVTISDEDAAWVARSCARLDHPRPAVATLRRMAGTALLNSALEGVVFAGDGVLRRHGALWPPAADLPDLIIRESTILLADPALLAAGPVIDEPVVLLGAPVSQHKDVRLLHEAIALHILAPALPRFARIPRFSPAPDDEPDDDSAPESPSMDSADVLAAIGLALPPILEIDAPVCQLQDAIWLDSEQAETVPAILLRRFRDHAAARAVATVDPKRRIILRDPALAFNPRIRQFLDRRGFIMVALEDLTQPARVALFQQAEMIIAASGPALAYLVFCAERTLVLELAPDDEFDPRAWLLSAKLGLRHGILPCAVDGGVMRVELPRLRALLRAFRGAGDDAA
jgi:hypothetical protein